MERRTSHHRQRDRPDGSTDTGRRRAGGGGAEHPLLRLQRQVGNQATTLFVQRDKLLTETMAPASVDSAIRNAGGKQEDNVGKHTWVRKDAYVSNWDHPARPNGKSSTWGFSTAHWLSDAATWVIHVHRSAAGKPADKGAANVQSADLEGKGGTKDFLTTRQLERIGIPSLETPSPYVKRRWKQLGKPGE